MRKKIISLLTLGLLITVTWSIFGTYAETEVPSLSVGDSWTYGVTDDYTGEVHHHTVTVDGKEDFEGVPCYVCTTNYLTSTIKEWLTTEEGDWVLLKTNFNIPENQEIVNETYSPGLKLFDFPLSVGKEWSGESNISCSVKLGNGEIVYEPPYISSWHRKVISAETVTVPAGTFDTYLVEEIIFYNRIEEIPIRKYWYFCDDVENYIKHEIYHADWDELDSRGELTSYELAQQGNSSSNLPLMIAIPTIIGVLGIAFFLYNRRNQGTLDA